MQKLSCKDNVFNNNSGDDDCSDEDVDGEEYDDGNNML